MIYGYAKATPDGPNLNDQIKKLQKAGCEEILCEEIGLDPRDNPVFDELILKLDKGDSVVVASLEAVARKTRRLLWMIAAVTEKDATFKSVDESWLDTKDKGQMKAYNGLLEFSMKSRRDRAMDAHKAACKRGRPGGRPPIGDEKMARAIEMYDNGKHSMAEICQETGLKRSTIYDYLQKRKRAGMMPPPPPPPGDFEGHFPPPPPPHHGFEGGYPPPPPHCPHGRPHHPSHGEAYEEFHRCDEHPHHGGPHFPPPPPVDIEEGE